MTEKILIVFDRGYMPYNPGEVAGFDKKAAEEILALEAPDADDRLVPIAHLFDPKRDSLERPVGPQTPEEMLQVTFSAGYPPYNAGETAGFPKSEALRLVANGMAVIARPPLTAAQIKAMNMADLKDAAEEAGFEPKGKKKADLQAILLALAPSETDEKEADEEPS